MLLQIAPEEIVAHYNTLVPSSKTLVLKRLGSEDSYGFELYNGEKKVTRLCGIIAMYDPPVRDLEIFLKGYVTALQV